MAHSLQFSTVTAATANMTELSLYEYDWRHRPSHVNMADSNLTKYDWRWWLGDGGSNQYKPKQQY